MGASSCVTTATGGTTAQTLADRAGLRKGIKDFGATCDGSTDDTAAWTSAIANLPANKILVVNCSSFVSSPQSISVPATASLAFEGSGSLTWNFGTVQSISVPNQGRAYTSIPTASITGNATLGAVLMQLYTPTIVSGGASYVVGDILTLPGGTGTAATIKVATVNGGGAVTGYTVQTSGSYSVLPSGTLSLTGGTGTGATITATYQVRSIAVTSGGTYASSSIPAVTLSGGSPDVAAEAVAVGQRPTLSGTVTGADRQIFGGYAHTAGTFNGGEGRAAWFGVSGAASDNTTAIQAAIDSEITTRFTPGLFQITGTLIVGPNTKLFGAGSTGSTDGGFAQFGTQIWGTGTGQAMIRGRYVAANSGMSIRDLSISNATTSSYNWTVEVPGMASSEWLNVNIQNNWSGATGAAHWVNENPTTSITALYAPTWVNRIQNVTMGAAGGMPLDSELTDSRYVNAYLSGGTGSLEAGANNTYGDVMVDNASGACLTIAPHNAASATYISVFGGNFQFCTTAAIAMGVGSSGSNPLTQYVDIAGVNFNNSNSATGDISITNSSNVTISGNSFGTSSAANIAATGTSDYLIVSGNTLPNGTSGVIGAHSIVSGNTDGAFGGGAILNLKTANGNAVQINDVASQNLPIQMTPGRSSVSAASISIGGNVNLNLNANNPIGLQQGGTSSLDVTTGAIRGYRPFADQSEVIQTSGASYTVAANIGRVILDGVNSTYAVTTPASPIDGQPLIIECGSAVTALTITANSGQTMKGTPGACSTTQGHAFHYRTSNTAWYMDY